MGDAIITKMNTAPTYPGGAPTKPQIFFILKNFHRKFHFRENVVVVVGQVCFGAAKPTDAL